MNENIKSSSHLSEICKINGALFYYRPVEFAQHGLEQILENSLIEQTNDDQLQQILTAFKTYPRETLTNIYDEYLAGIGKLDFPPWGSVYLDKESILFGDSTAKYKDFLTKYGFTFNTNNRDPVDHFGLMLMVVGELLSAPSSNEILDELLSYHLLPWAPFYLKNLKQVMPDSPYTELISFTEIILEQLVTILSIDIKPRTIFYKAK